MKIATVRRFALGLADVTEAPHHHFGSFRVGGRIFVTLPPDGASINVFVPEDLRAPVLAVHGDYVQKLFWGGKVVGLQIALHGANPKVVKALICAAWKAKRGPTKLTTSATSVRGS
jgi:hypothetical protein